MDKYNFDGIWSKIKEEHDTELASVNKFYIEVQKFLEDFRIKRENKRKAKYKKLKEQL